MKCPICKKPLHSPTPGSAAPYFPFCSERCKLIDLGRWLEGKYQIPLHAPEEPSPSEDADGEKQ